jgi:hypothetical protein
MKHLFISMLLGATLAWWFASANAGEANAAGRQIQQEKHDAARRN